MTEPKTINEAGLTDIARRATDTHDATSGCACMDALRVVSEVRRLRQLVIDAEPYVPDNEQTRTMIYRRASKPRSTVDDPKPLNEEDLAAPPSAE